MNIDLLQLIILFTKNIVTLQSFPQKILDPEHLYGICGIIGYLTTKTYMYDG